MHKHSPLSSGSEAAVKVLQSEAAALRAAAARPGNSMNHTADIILNSQGKAILAG